MQLLLILDNFDLFFYFLRKEAGFFVFSLKERKRKKERKKEKKEEKKAWSNQTQGIN
jgi:hypothetical protein